MAKNQAAAGRLETLKQRFFAIPKYTRLGILGVMMMYLGLAGLVSVTAAWTVRGDTMQHLDYTWRLYHGDIPRFEDRIRYEPFIKYAGRGKPQQASVHPPLFYIIHAPFVGELLDQGKWHQAIAVGRALNVGIGLLCVAALAWGGWVLGRSRRALFAVAVPAVTVTMYRFVRLNVDYALDNMLVLFATVALIYTYKILRDGLTKRNLAMLAAVSVLGMCTKAPYIVILAVSALGVVLAALLHEKGDRNRKLLRGALIAGGLVALVAAVIGWFYYLRNYKSTGSLFSSLPADYTGGRKVQSFAQVMTSSRLWSLFYGLYSNVPSVSVALTSFVVAGLLTTKIADARKLFREKPYLWMIGLCLLAYGGIFATQVQHAVGIGAINFRYMLPVMLPIGLLFSYSLLAFENARGQLVTLAAAALGGTAIWVLGGKSIGMMFTKAAANGIPHIVTGLLGLIAIAGAVVLAVSMYRLTAVRKPAKAR